MGLQCDAVFQGGGVKGIGLVGAVAAIEKAGYEFVNLAGSSAGAIVSALLAVGYSSDELKNELNELNYLKLKQELTLSKFGLMGGVLSVIFNYGIYSADYFENWLESLLRRKNKTRFKDIETGFAEVKYRYKFNAIASDLTEKKMLVLPGDLKQFGYDPGEYSIAKAVRMSMSIPLFFEPFKLQDIDGKEHILVDGGLLSNYPIWLLDDNSKNPSWPTFGFKFTTDAADYDGASEHKQSDEINNVLNYIISLLHTMLDAHDNFHVSNSSGDFERTIFISNELQNGKNRPKISTTDFDITSDECEELFSNGFSSAQRFLSKWDFSAWKKKYRE
ncbi:MAG: patatin-like phospholipase family protein [Firmicutes bacterium]|nr:patatin-like phospholipase family protein [Bacillota bacterium]